jgi:hypothetical protein
MFLMQKKTIFMNHMQMKGIFINHMLEDEPVLLTCITTERGAEMQMHDLPRGHPTQLLVHHADFFSLLFVMLSELCSQ